MPLQAPRDASKKASTWSLQIPAEHLHDMDMKQKSGRHRRSLKEVGGPEYLSSEFMRPCRHESMIS